MDDSFSRLLFKAAPVHRLEDLLTADSDDDVFALIDS